ncbi:hypothetical protein BU15DRAFT_62085 [Melanogaster broomeanus]|nr:hypothetical protein BU15DRAFT_62085 [Melanogaster broomeanus]
MYSATGKASGFVLEENAVSAVFLPSTQDYRNHICPSRTQLLRNQDLASGVPAWAKRRAQFAWSDTITLELEPPWLGGQKPIIAGHSFQTWREYGSCVAWLLLLGRFDFGHVVVSDSAATHCSVGSVLTFVADLQKGLEPWSQSISAPLLAVNSEEVQYVTDDEFTQLLTMALAVATHEIITRTCQIFHVTWCLIAGSTHPS